MNTKRCVSYTYNTQKTEKDKIRRKKISAFGAFCSSVGLLTIFIAGAFAAIYLLGVIYNLFEPIASAVIEFFFAYGANIMVVIVAIGIVCYVVDYILDNYRR